MRSLSENEGNERVLGVGHARYILRNFHQNIRMSLRLYRETYPVVSSQLCSNTREPYLTTMYQVHIQERSPTFSVSGGGDEFNDMRASPSNILLSYCRDI